MNSMTLRFRTLLADLQLLFPFGFRVPSLALVVAAIAREYAGIREELDRINEDEPGYVSERAILRVAPVCSDAQSGR